MKFMKRRSYCTSDILYGRQSMYSYKIPLFLFILFLMYYRKALKWQYVLVDIASCNKKHTESICQIGDNEG